MAQKREPAAIRYKNPGAMWPGKVATKWGSTHYVVLNDGTGQGGNGQGNKIAVFDTWVQGICAQLDLWRTSPKYKNKKFKDAIHIWDGGNDTPAYIAYVKARVPGMDENTVMNDAFWRSPNGVKFLKAQSGHEAGKAIPAPAADWTEAQRIVFGDKKTAPKPVEPAEFPTAPATRGEPDGALIVATKKKLDALGYHEFGTLDEEWGGRTVAAIAAYKLDRGMTGPAEIDDALLNQLDKDLSEGWTRPMKDSRANATVKDLAPVNETIKQNWWTRLWAKIVAIPAGVGALFSGVMDRFPDAKATYIDPVMEFFVDVPGWLWCVAAAGIAASIWIGTRKADTTVVKSYNTGRLLR